MDDMNMIEQEEEQAEAKAVALAEEAGTEEHVTTLFEDVVRSIGSERERINEAEGKHFASGFESYAVLNAAIEEKAAVEKDLKDNLKNLWTAVKAKNDTEESAYLKEIERVARQSAMAWVRVAAIAQKAEASL